MIFASAEIWGVPVFIGYSGSYARFQRLRDRNGRIRGGFYLIREIAE